MIREKSFPQSIGADALVLELQCQDGEEIRIVGFCLEVVPSAVVATRTASIYFNEAGSPGYWGVELFAGIVASVRTFVSVALGLQRSFAGGGEAQTNALPDIWFKRNLTLEITCPNLQAADEYNNMLVRYEVRPASI